MNIKLEVVDRDLIVTLPAEAKALSMTVHGGGFKRNLKYVVFHEVPHDFNNNPKEECKSVLKKLNLDPNKSAVFLTAVRVSEMYVSIEGAYEGVKCSVTATVGLNNPVSIPPNSISSLPSTINILAIVDKDVPFSGLVELVKVVADARASALHDVDLRCNLKYAIGTSTDAFIVASLGYKPTQPYTGPATPVGKLVSQLVYRAVMEGAEKAGFSPGRSMIRRLEERGVELKDIIEAALDLFIPWSGLDVDEARSIIERELISCLNDINVSSFISAALRLDEDAKLGLIPNLTPEQYLQDPVHLVVDEILGLSLAIYLNGWNAVFELYRYDTKKPGILSKLTPFLDDIIAALIAGVTSRIYSKFIKKAS